jgi:hypothetical protein
MAILSRHRCLEGALGVGSFGVLVAAAAATNETLRAELVGVLSGESSNDLVLAGGRLQQELRAVMGAIRDHATTQTPLVLFAFAGVALLLLMLRR